MADVRSMLRAERAARAPPAKSKKQTLTAPPVSKKRKAEDDEATDARKRTRAEELNNLPAGFFDGGAEPTEELEDEKEAPLPGFVAAKEQPSDVVALDLPSTSEPVQLEPQKDKAQTSMPATGPVDDDEWAAFEREVAAAPSLAPQQSALDALKSGATIEAAPMSAAEAAAQARQEQNAQRGRREEELEGEKEDAARHLEEEFEEMEALEERVKRLREKREKLRRPSKSEADVEPPAVAEAQEESQEGDSEDDDDEWDGWRFGAS